MNNKVKLIAATFAVGMAAIMAGCDGCLGCNGCSSCGGSSSTGSVTHSNWFTGTSYNGIQPSFVQGHDNFSAEEITYTVEYDKKSSNENVELDYKEGKFATTFYAFEYDWSKEGTPEGYANSKPEILYCYKTELSIKVKFRMLVGDKRESDWFEDSVVTESYFRAAGKNLQPVYSRQDIKSTSPAELRPTTLTAAYKKINVTYENFYNYNCTRVLTKTTEDGETTEQQQKVSSYVFDNSSLYIVARSMLSTLSQSVKLYSPAAGGTDTYALTAAGSAFSSDEEINDAERKKYTDALTAQGLYKSSGEEDKGVTATAVSVSYAGGDLHGTSQTIWYAALSDNKDYNVSRATMLKLSVPISFGLGALNYNLDEIKSTLW